MLINDLQTMLDTFKFVDHVTLCEVVDPSTSQMQLAARQMVEWLLHNVININMHKENNRDAVGPDSVEPTAPTFGQQWYGRTRDVIQAAGTHYRQQPQLGRAYNKRVQ